MSDTVPKEWAAYAYEYKLGRTAGLQGDGAVNPVRHRADWIEAKTDDAELSASALTGEDVPLSKAHELRPRPTPRRAWYAGYKDGKQQRKEARYV